MDTSLLVMLATKESRVVIRPARLDAGLDGADLPTVTESRRFEARLIPIKSASDVPGKASEVGRGATLRTATLALFSLMRNAAVGERGSDAGASRLELEAPNASQGLEFSRAEAGGADDAAWLANCPLDIVVARDDGDDLCFEAFCRAVHPGLVIRGGTIDEVFENLEMAMRD